MKDSLKFFIIRYIYYNIQNYNKSLLKTTLLEGVSFENKKSEYTFSFQYAKRLKNALKWILAVFYDVN